MFCPRFKVSSSRTISSVCLFLCCERIQSRTSHEINSDAHTVSAGFLASRKVVEDVHYHEDEAWSEGEVRAPTLRRLKIKIIKQTILNHRDPCTNTPELFSRTCRVGDIANCFLGYRTVYVGIWARIGGRQYQSRWRTRQSSTEEVPAKVLMAREYCLLTALGDGVSGR